MPIITVLLNLYGDVVRSHLEIFAYPPSELAASEASFHRFGLPQLEMRYVGATSIETPAKTVFVVFGAMGSRELDRTLVQHFFPQVFSQGPPLNEGIWILFDHDGRVLRSGQDGRPVEDVHGHPLQLTCVWLASGSPPPKS